jgi:hypothetical protein
MKGNTIGGDVIVHIERASTEIRDPAGLQTIRESVRQFWIEPVLEDSIEDDLLLEIAKITQIKAVAHPLAREARLPLQPPQLLPAGRTMESIFKDAGRALLILGQAGAGKTISLLELARDLMDRADQDGKEPVPVILNLSTWCDKTPLSDWILDEMKAKYLVPPDKGRPILEGYLLVMLLDGLDEVRAERRAACVEAINQFVLETGIPGIAVCCRLEEYNALPAQLTLQGAVCLQPLTADQVDEYLARADPGLEVLRAHLQTDNQLQELAKTPLMLNLMSVAYRGLTPEALSAGALDTVEERRQHLFARYVEAMFDRRETEANVRGPMIRGMSWLARQMRAHAESVFLIERLQPDWLKTSAERRLYIMASRLLCGAVLGLVIGAILDVVFGLTAPAPGEPGEEAWDFLKHLGVGLLFGSVNGILVGLMDIWRFERRRRRTVSPGDGVTARVVVEVAGYALALILLNWLLVTVTGKVDTLGTSLMGGVLVGLLFGLFFGVHGGFREIGNDIRTVEALDWSWAGLRRSAGRGLLAGTAVGIIVGITVRLAGNPAGQELSVAAWLAAGLLTGLLGAFLGSIVGAAFGSLESRIITRRATPNQGIRLSLRNALLAGAASGPMVAVVLSGAALPFVSASQAANSGLVGGLLIGMLAALRAGGFDAIQHYTLRLILAARGYTPLDYTRFLDSAASFSFLLNAGGAYLFVHPLLLEHFVEGSTAGGLDPRPSTRDLTHECPPPLKISSAENPAASWPR